MNRKERKEVEIDRKLKKVFDDVKMIYFPRWKAGAEWRVYRNHPRVRDRIGIRAVCLPDKKIIVVKLPNRRDYVNLIHEICHAVTNSNYHKKKWRARMNKIADRAEQLGQKELAEYIRGETKEYLNEPRNLRDYILLGDGTWQSERELKPETIYLENLNV
jgi:hypothetical protein